MLHIIRVLICLALKVCHYATSATRLIRGGNSAVGSGRASRPARPRPTALPPPRSNGKPEAATAVYKLLMMGMRMPKTC
jgi:hypothetical protein